MEQWIGRVALVTGASSGIGAEIARALVEEGMVVVGVALDVDPIEQKSLEYKTSGMKGRLFAMKCDISQAENVKNLFDAIRADPDLEGVDVCVNNAAVAYAEPFLTGNPDVWKSMVETNFLGAAYVTQESFKTMIDRNVDDGHIIYMNSLAGQRLLPGNKELHMYSATKFALRSLLEGVRCELRALDSHIRVSAVSPGVVETNVYLKLFEGDEDKAKKFLSERKYLVAEDVARSVVFILSQPPHVQIHDILMRSTEQIP